MEGNRKGKLQLFLRQKGNDVFLAEAAQHGCMKITALHSGSPDLFQENTTKFLYNYSTLQQKMEPPYENFKNFPKGLIFAFYRAKLMFVEFYRKE